MSRCPGLAHDPRAAFTPDHPLASVYSAAHDTGTVLVHQTKHSGLRVAAAMDHLIEAPTATRTESQAFDDAGLVSISVDTGTRSEAQADQVCRVRLVG